MGYEIGIEEGNADFEGMGHAGAVHLGEDAFLKVKFGAEVKNPFQPAGEATSVGETGDILKGVVAVKFVADIWRKQVVTLGIATSPHPKEKADFGGKAQTFEELGHEKRKAFVVVGDGKALDEMVDGNADAYREEGKTLDEKVGLKAGVAGEKFIPSVSAQHGFHLARCQTGKKPGGN